MKTTVEVAEKADSTDPGHVAAPFSGAVTIRVAVGDSVEIGQTVATIEAMKMEASITSSVSGVITRLAFTDPHNVEAGDLIVAVTPEEQ